jgi:predicted dehydrogenase
MNDRKLKIGIIGVGKISELHVPGYMAHPNAEIVAVCDNNESNIQTRAKNWGYKYSYNNYRDLIDNDEVDVVDIITPHNLHAEMAIYALQNNKHVTLQKPMAINVSECQKIIKAAKNTEKRFRVFENFRFYPPLIKAKQILDSGEIGEPISIRMKAIQGTLKYGWDVPRSTLEWRYDEKQSGGGRVVFDYGYHLFSVAIHFLGPVDSVFAFINEVPNDKGWVRDSPSIISWKYKNNERHGSWEAVSSDDLVLHSDYWAEDEWFEISGTKGFIWVNRCTGKLLNKPPLEVYSNGKSYNFDLDQIDWDWGTSFKDGMIDFIDSIINDRQSPIDGNEGLDVLKFARAAQKSSREQALVKVDSIN